MNMTVLDHETLLRLNESSIEAGRAQNLTADQLPAESGDRYWINAHKERDQDNRPEVALCVVLNLDTGQTVWLDVSSEEFAAIPEVDVPEAEWETAMCAGNPPSAW